MRMATGWLMISDGSCAEWMILWGQGRCCVVSWARARPRESVSTFARQVAETATQFFISGDRPNVSGLVLAGSADFKTELSQSDMFDQRLQAVILAVVDVSYGVLSFAPPPNPDCKPVFVWDRWLAGNLSDLRLPLCPKYCLNT
jgi:eRF1 domain 2